MDDGVIQDNIQKSHCIRLLQKQIIVGEVNCLLLDIQRHIGAVGSGDNKESVLNFALVFPFSIEEIQPILKAYIGYLSGGIGKKQFKRFRIFKTLYICCCGLWIKGDTLGHCRLKEQAEQKDC